MGVLTDLSEFSVLDDFRRADFALMCGADEDEIRIDRSRYADGAGARFEFVGARWTGHQEISRPADGMYVTVESFKSMEDLTFEIAGADLIKFHFKVCGDNVISLGPVSNALFSGCFSSFLTHASGAVKRDVVSGGMWQEAVTVAYDRSAFTRLYGDPALAGPASKEHELKRHAMTPEMVSAVRALIANPFSGHLRGVFAEAKALELSCAFIDRIQGSRRDDAALSPRETRRVHEARARLLDRLHDAPGLDALARQVGLNRLQLCRGFKALFGRSVYEVLQAERLAEAARMLRDGDLSVALIAERVGYQHQSSFATAFKARFGVTPRFFRTRH